MCVTEMKIERRRQVVGPVSDTSRRPRIRAKLDRLPASPGVYRFLDRKGKVIYVGKAKSLRSRVRSYFRGGDDGRMFFPLIVKKTHDLDYFVVGNEKEALLLENNLIKKDRPRFNITLRDDKTYLSLKVTKEEKFPRVVVVRRVKKDGGKYFGPYSSASAVRKTLKMVRKTFPLRTCSNANFRNRSRPCIQYEIHRCGAPCVGLQSEEEYGRIVDEMVLFLRGRNTDVLRRLEKRRDEEAERLNFEAAARIRDQIRDLQKTVEGQRISHADLMDRDVFGYARDGDLVVVEAIYIREGKLVSSRSFRFESPSGLEKVFDSFLGQHYTPEREVPKEILAPGVGKDRETLEDILSERRGSRVKIRVPKRGEKRSLVGLATKNAEVALERGEAKEKAAEEILRSLGGRLQLRSIPQRIECFDISHIQGAYTVGGMVTYQKGEPFKSGYRRFRIRTVEGSDDFASLREVITRRYRRALAEAELPDLVIIDGGAGQLSASLDALRELGLEEMDIVALAKSRLKGDSRSPERVFKPGRSAPIVLPQDSPEVYLLARVRDEAHRFAISYHRTLRKKETIRKGGRSRGSKTRQSHQR